MKSTLRLAKAVATGRRLVDEMTGSLPSFVDPLMFTLKSRLPFTATMMRELLIHRVVALASAAVSSFEKSNYLAGTVLTRSIFETVALAFKLKQDLNRYTRIKFDEALHSRLMKYLLANSEPYAKHKPIDVMSLVNNMDKKVAGFRDVYQRFSQFAHPNQVSTLGCFGLTDPKTSILHLGMTEDSSAWGSGVHALNGALAEFLDIYKALETLIISLNQRLENDA